MDCLVIFTEQRHPVKYPTLKSNSNSTDAAIQCTFSGRIELMRGPPPTGIWRNGSSVAAVIRFSRCRPSCGNGAAAVLTSEEEISLETGSLFCSGNPWTAGRQTSVAWLLQAQ